ncbi:acyltransferase [Longimycelium tulufanense]|uniref:Acyltransferase n=1 Tax=Longimycelium tulufanense TaxID=907463 RepID=A0A8J3FTY5_9PSEU|nr:acyltransferase [Longimycelium tulufanense]GGM50639.1 acyltransferase [Longimycelium tulufanense]
MRLIPELRFGAAEGELVPSVSRSRLPSLTGLRFVAAFVVFLTHLDISWMLMPVAMAAVSFFFVLSGFVLTWSARESEPYQAFWRHRFWKIFPNHAVTWVTMMGLLAATGISAEPGRVPPGPTPAGPALANLFLVHTWLPAPTLMFSVNPVSWTLAAEAAFYLLFPLILPLVMRVRPERLLVAAGIAVAAIWLVPTLSFVLHGPAVLPGEFDLPLVRLWFADYLPLSRLPEFVLGMLLARMVRRGVMPRIGVVLPGIALLTAVAVAGKFLPIPFWFAAATIGPVALMIVGAASMDLRGARSLWATRSPVFLGQLSFAFYLIHYQVITLFEHVFGDWPRGTLGTLGVGVLLCGVSVFLAWLLYRFVEQPLMQRFSHRSPAGPRA